MGRGQSSDRYIYAVAVEAFFHRAMAGRLDGVTRAALRDAGIALDQPLLSVYPAPVFHRCVALAAAAAYPGATPDAAQYRVGRDHIDAFVQTYPGKMMAALARQIDARTILDYTSTFIRLGNNYTETRTRPLGPSCVELWMNDVCGVPAFYRGIVQRGLEIAEVRDATVTSVEGVGAPAAAYEVRWTEP
jgi:uncharacterized protein (TIGR02265 family)